MIIGLTGYARSGKDFVADFLVENYAFTKFVFSDILSQVLKEFGWDDTKENQSKLGVALRKASTQHILASMLCKKLKNQKNVVVAGFRSPGEVELFRESFGQDFSLIYLKRDFEKRFNSRRDLHLSEEEFRGRDIRDGKEMGLDSIVEDKLYDFEVENNESKEILFQKVAEQIGQVKSLHEARLALERRLLVKNNYEFLKWIDSFQKQHGPELHKKEHYYLTMALMNTRVATCLRRRHGAIIVKDDRIIGSGYNGAQRGIVDCLERKMCFRQMMEIPIGTRYEACVSTHAEENAINFTHDRHNLEGATLYIVGIDHNGGIYDAQPCNRCARTIIQMGIKKVVCAAKPETDKKLFRVFTHEELSRNLETGNYFPQDVREHKCFQEYQDNVIKIRKTWDKYKDKK